MLYDFIINSSQKLVFFFNVNKTRVTDIFCRIVPLFAVLHQNSLLIVLYCRWCANGGEMVCCDKCTSAYCKQCIIRNFSRKKFTEINDCDRWDCFQCDPKPIFPQR